MAMSTLVALFPTLQHRQSDTLRFSSQATSAALLPRFFPRIFGVLGWKTTSGEEAPQIFSPLPPFSSLVSAFSNELLKRLLDVVDEGNPAEEEETMSCQNRDAHAAPVGSTAAAADGTQWEEIAAFRRG